MQGKVLKSCRYFVERLPEWMDGNPNWRWEEREIHLKMSYSHPPHH